MVDSDREPEVTESGIAAGQGKTPQQVEDSTLCAAWALMAFVGIVGAVLLYRFIEGLVAKIGELL